jgi:hypothetical protein
MDLGENAMACFKILSQDSVGGTDVTLDLRQVTRFQPKFETGSS